MTDVHGPLLTKMADIHGLPLTRMATKLCFFFPTAKMAISHVFMLSLRIFTVLLGYTRLSSRWHSHRLFCTLRPPPASTFALARYCCWQIAVDTGSSHAQHMFYSTAVLCCCPPRMHTCCRTGSGTGTGKPMAVSATATATQCC